MLWTQRDRRGGPRRRVGRALPASGVVLLYTCSCAKMEMKMKMGNGQWAMGKWQMWQLWVEGSAASAASAAAPIGQRLQRLRSLLQLYIDIIRMWVAKHSPNVSRSFSLSLTLSLSPLFLSDLPSHTIEISLLEIMLRANSRAFYSCHFRFTLFYANDYDPLACSLTHTHAHSLTHSFTRLLFAFSLNNPTAYNVA